MVSTAAAVLRVEIVEVLVVTSGAAAVLRGVAAVAAVREAVATVRFVALEQRGSHYWTTLRSLSPQKVH